MITEALSPLKPYEPTTVLQKTIMLSKQHRNLHCPDENIRPISIILTTLGAESFQGSAELTNSLDDISKGFLNVLKDSQGIYSIKNPVDPKENFADKWKTDPGKMMEYFRWAKLFRNQVCCLLQAESSQEQIDQLKKMFGEAIVSAALTKLGQETEDDVNSRYFNLIPYLDPFYTNIPLISAKRMVFSVIGFPSGLPKMSKKFTIDSSETIKVPKNWTLNFRVLFSDGSSLPSDATL